MLVRNVDSNMTLTMPHPRRRLFHSDRRGNLRSYTLVIYFLELRSVNSKLTADCWLLTADWRNNCVTHTRHSSVEILLFQSLVNVSSLRYCYPSARRYECVFNIKFGSFEADFWICPHWLFPNQIYYFSAHSDLVHAPSGSSLQDFRRVWLFLQLRNILQVASSGSHPPRLTISHKRVA
jgi:hypothetical protein